MTCVCGHEYYTHRGRNTECHGASLTFQGPLPRRFYEWPYPHYVIEWSRPEIWCDCKSFRDKEAA